MPLFQRQIHSLFAARDKFVLHNNPGAGIPSEESVVIAGWTQFFGLFVGAHGPAKEFIGLKTAARPAAVELGFGAALEDDGRIIGAFVRVAQSGNDFLRLSCFDSVALVETVG